MPIANSTYVRGRKAKVRGQAESALKNKSKYSMTKSPSISKILSGTEHHTNKRRINNDNY